MRAGGEPGGGAPGRAWPQASRTWAQAPALVAFAAFAEVRARLLWRRLRGRGGVPELVARITLFAVAIPAGLAFAGLTAVASWDAVRAGQGIRAAVPVTALFFGVWQTWTVVALSLSDREALDLSRFLVYPIPPGRLFAYGLGAAVTADPFAVFWCLLLAGAFAGAALARPGAWLVPLAAAYALFVVATTAGVALLQELLARLLRRRGARPLAIAALYGGVASLLAWGGPGTRPADALRTIRALTTVRWIAFPAALADEAVRALYARRVGDALPWLLALAASGVAAGWLAFRLALAQARSGGEAPPVRGAEGGEGWPIPGAVMGPLLEKELKYLVRHPLTSVLLLLLPALAAFVGWKASPLIPAEAGEVIRALPLFGLALYAHLATQVVWLNAFGWDRGGARLPFLAPVPPARVLAAKNLSTYALSLVLFCASAAALLATAGVPPPWALLGALALHAGIAPWFLGAGNVVSILNPRAASHALQRGGRLSPVSALAGMAIVSAGAALFAAPVLLALRLEAPWLLVAAWGALGAAGLAIYRATLPRAGALLAARREPLLDAVAGDVEG